MTNLKDVLGVLDQASVVSDRRAELLAAVTRVDSPHTISDLATAVDAHLACKPVVAAPSALPTSFDFGWDRPKIAEDLTFQATMSKRAKWASKQTNKGSEISAWVARRAFGWILGTFVLGVGVSIYFNDIVGACIMMSGLLSGVMGGMLADMYINRAAEAQKVYTCYFPSKKDAKTFLEVDDAKSYLRAVKFSTQPHLLIGDFYRLRELVNDHNQVRRKIHRAAENEEVKSLLAMV